MHIPAPSPRVRWFVRAVAWVLVHWCSTVTLAGLERAIIGEVIARAKHARSNQPSPAQSGIRGAWTRWRIKRAVAHLHRRLEAWKFEYQSKP